MSGLRLHKGFRFILLLLLSVNLSAQNSPLSPLPQKDTLKSGPGARTHSLYGGAGYGSNLIYLGSTISRNNPYYYTNFTYSYKNSLYAAITPVNLSGFDPWMAFFIASVSYNHVFNSWFDISTSAYRYQVAPSLRNTLFNNFTYGDLTLGFDWKLLYTKVSVTGLLADENQSYFQIRNSRYFQTPEFFKGKADISFDPYVNVLFGTLEEITTTTLPDITVASPGHGWSRYYTGTSTISSTSRKFGPLEADFGLPVAFNTSFMTLEAEVDYILPFYNESVYPGSKGFVFLFSAFFRIF
ncbi:MAG: hypothetical protein WCE64_02430 [Bacteroidales bacterium]